MYIAPVNCGLATAWRLLGTLEAHSLVEHLGSVERAMAQAAEGLTGLAARSARQWSRG